MSMALAAVVVGPCDQDGGVFSGPPLVVASTMPNVSKKRDDIDHQQEKVVGDSNGKTIVQNRRQGEAPSMAAASMSDFDRLQAGEEEQEVMGNCFQTAATTIRVRYGWNSNR